MLEQERRLVTVLFADIVGFTALADELDPEVLQELVSGIFEGLAEEAIRYDGTIEKFIGDAIFVIFGAPIAHEDDPQRALRTALAMQHVFAEHAARLKKERGFQIGLRIGIHTGLVVAGGVRAGAEYGVMGDTVNTASRLQSAAAAGEIYVTQATFRLTNREFAFREVGPITMKGKEQPVLAYALAAERAEARERLELNAPLVGRWMELSRLDLAFQSARIGRTEVVLVAGEPGIGKSRLLAEFVGLVHSAEETGEAASLPRVLRWTFSRENQRSYAGFIEPLRGDLGLDPSAPQAREKLAAALEGLGFLSPLMPELLAQFLGLPGAARPERESEEWKRSLYIAVFDLLAGLARERPLVYVLEDLHFADPASLELLWFIASRPSRVPMLFLLAQRLGQGAPEPRPSRTNFTQIVLEPLTDEEAARIVESAFDWAPDALRDRIVARAGGNPFFIEESIRSLVESGAIARDTGGEWRVRDASGALEVPATLHAVIAARVDRLPAAAKECLQLASVIGERFGARVLLEAGGARLADTVDTLIAADLVAEAAPGERREGRFRFKHAVTQEVAYNTLLVRRRAELHRRVAAAMERTLSPEELVEFTPALAHHYLLGEDDAKAASYAWRAAQSAVAIHAYVDAIRFGEMALELYEKLGDMAAAIEAVYLVGRVHRYRGENDLALTLYERGLADLERSGASPEALARLIAAMAEICTRWGATHPDLAGLIAKGLAVAGPAPSRDRARLLAAQAFAPRRKPGATSEDWQDSLRTAKEALAIAEQLDLLREISLCLDAVGYAQRELGRFREALASNRRRLPLAESLHDSDEIIDAHTMVAEATMVLGDLDEAIVQAAKAREIATSTEKPRLGIRAIEAEALAYLLRGDFQNALATTARAEQFASAKMDRPATTIHRVAMAAAAALGSDEERVARERLLAVSARAVAAGDLLAAIYGQRDGTAEYRAARAAGWPQSTVSSVLWGAPVVLAAARWGIADDELAARVGPLVESAGHARGQALLVQAAGLRALGRGEHARAEKLLFDATQAFSSLRLDHARAVACADHARALDALGRSDDAAAERAEARRLAERLGAAALLGRLKASASAG